MNWILDFASNAKATALSAVVVLAVASPAFAQRRTSVGDYYGSGPSGTIGRGTYRLPGGPSDWDGPGHSVRSNSNATSYSRGYRGLASTSAAAAAPASAPAPAPASAARPYMTNQSYSPGDGNNYPLYFNPATRTYYYYPMGRR